MGYRNLFSCIITATSYAAFADCNADETEIAYCDTGNDKAMHLCMKPQDGRTPVLHYAFGTRGQPAELDLMLEFNPKADSESISSDRYNVWYGEGGAESIILHRNGGRYEYIFDIDHQDNSASIRVNQSDDNANITTIFDATCLQKSVRLHSQALSDEIRAHGWYYIPEPYEGETHTEGWIETKDVK